ncbi:MAG: alpha/beta fold hydrolase [Pseudooceanicola sp.]
MATMRNTVAPAIAPGTLTIRLAAVLWLTAGLLSLASLAQAETATVDGHEIYYEVHGDLDSGRTPALLLHGGMNSIDINFTGLIPLLEADRPVIAVEQQGHGHTGDRDAPVTLDSMRADTLGVLDHLGVGEAHVIGFSMGGMLGLDLAVNAPDRVATLTAISASQNVEGMHPEILAMNRDPSTKPSPEVAARLPTEEDFAEMQAAMAENPSGAENFPVMMEKLSTLMTGGWGWSDAELEGIDAPVLLAIGDRDFILPEHAAEMAETIPNARLAILPDTTHTTIMKRPDLLAPMIRDLMDAG